jgi:hypothetical protein
MFPGCTRWEWVGVSLGKNKVWYRKENRFERR